MRAHEDTLWWYVHLRKILLKAMQAAACSPSRILDIGCGTGGNMDFLSRVFPQAQILGFDQNDHALELARTRKLTGLSKASAEQIPFTDGYFDAAICMDVLYHQNAEESKILAEARRVLKPGGFLFVNVPAFESLRGSHDRAVHGKRRYRSGKLKELFEKAGLKIVFFTYWNFTLFPVLWLWRKISPGQKSDVQMPSGFVNTLIKNLLDQEMKFLPLPYGSSLFAAAVK